MTSLLHGVVGAVSFTVLGVLLLIGGFLLADWLTPGTLRHQIWSERNRNAGIFLSSALLGIGAIVFTSIMTTYADYLTGLASTAIYGVLGILLMAGGFWFIDVLTPGKLGQMMVDPEPHPAVWVTGAINLSVAAIVCASIV